MHGGRQIKKVEGIFYHLTMLYGLGLSSRRKKRENKLFNEFSFSSGWPNLRDFQATRKFAEIQLICVMIWKWRNGAEIDAWKVLGKAIKVSQS